MSSHLLAARRYQRAVPVLPGKPVRGRRFTATCQARLGLPVGSTSVYRLPATLGDLTLQIDRGIEIPIDDQPTMLTTEHPRRQGQFGFHCPTGRTRLRRSKPTIGHHQPTTTPAHLVPQLPPDLTKTRVSQVPGQFPVLEHPGYVQFRDHHDADRGGPSGGELVQAITAQVGDPVVDGVALLVGFLPAFGGPLPGPPIWADTTRHSPRRARQVALC